MSVFEVWGPVDQRTVCECVWENGVCEIGYFSGQVELFVIRNKINAT